MEEPEPYKGRLQASAGFCQKFYEKRGVRI
jgi:hypothetical protein